VNDWWKAFFDQDYLRIWEQVFTEEANAKPIREPVSGPRPKLCGERLTKVLDPTVIDKNELLPFDLKITGSAARSAASLTSRRSDEPDNSSVP
jgi:hypothetical protein